MGAVSSCCAVEDADDRQVMKEPQPAAAAAAAAKEKPHSAKPRKESSSKEQSEQKSKDKERENKEAAKEEKKPKKQQQQEQPAVAVNQPEVEDLRKRLQGGMAIIVLLQDGTKLACTLHLNPSDKSLSISCEDKVRVIPLSDVKSLLHTRDQLKRVETKANLVDDENCVALHLIESGNCIPIRFEAVKDKHIFVEMMKQLKEEAEKNRN
ncbi:Apicomplexan CP 15/60K like protein, related [Eimeria tenella]|uniref:Apicomplexan CP 15/60K like protein, related n=1 Tax=Eimeria tenella TaxID=5802 RepID=U6KQE3_EIMTE|nr:Apicomplexan CP 15/60K like protein, related [Eimeria tenella]CDJ37658.1 Apicomplexan CP 15/60K like protein, related [Eimeria tenella]|eukprot:XP_013228496.1 Apicomplexan CP 15/60K like protein, related [Eimeria tenella]